jgi:nucleotide-binding universal stress UspA family protein
MPRSGPILIAFDGTPAAEHAIREGGPLLAGRAAVVLVVWKQGLGFELVALPASEIGLPPAAIDVDTALEVDRRLLEAAESQARRGVSIAREAGLDPQPLVVADDPDTAIHETILRVADQRDAAAILIGGHGHGPIAEMLLGGTTRGVLRQARVPVVVVRHAESDR